jgi:hypothetical protein
LLLRPSEESTILQWKNFSTSIAMKVFMIHSKNLQQPRWLCGYRSMRRLSPHIFIL